MNNSAATLGIEFAFRDMESCFDTLSCAQNEPRKKKKQTINNLKQM